MSWAEVKYALNSTLGTDKFAPLDTLIGGYKIFTEDGTFIVPENVHEIFVTGCGGGESGEESANYSSGGNGAKFIFNKRFSVSPLQKINITVGAGGDGDLQAGESTIVGNLITLPGASDSEYYSIGGEDGTTSSPRKGNGDSASFVANSFSSSNPDGIAGNSASPVKSGSGGGSLGAGSKGVERTANAIDKAGYGAGGRGGFHNNAVNTSGGDGIVIIAWGNISPYVILSLLIATE